MALAAVEGRLKRVSRGCGGGWGGDGGWWGKGSREMGGGVAEERVIERRFRRGEEASEDAEEVGDALEGFGFRRGGGMDWDSAAESESVEEPLEDVLSSLSSWGEVFVGVERPMIGISTLGAWPAFFVGAFASFADPSVPAFDLV